MPISLRPQNFRFFIGQEKLIKTLKVLISSSKQQKKCLDHLLFYGKPGIGKTSLANIIALKMEANIKFVQGFLLEKKSDILSLFASIKANDIVFIDEIHGINKSVEELLYSAMEDNVVDVFIGPEGESKVIRMQVPFFTLIGATTKLGFLSHPLKNRFGICWKLLDYTEKHISQIIVNSLKKLKWKGEEEAINLISSYAKKTPRIANNLLKRVIDFAIVNQVKVINLKIVKKAFKFLGLYKLGLNETHILYLECLNSKFNKKSVSLETISTIIFEDKKTIEVDIEPILLERGFILKNSSGRKITSLGIEYLQQIKK